MELAGDTPDDDNLWLDADGELRWEAVTRTLAFVSAIGALLAAVGVWLILSGHLLDGLCQTSRASTDKALLDACQGRLDDGAAQLQVLADAARPAALALASGIGAVLVLGVMMLLGVAERTRSIAVRFDTPATWTARVLVAFAALTTAWLAIGSIQRLLSVQSLL